LRARPGRGILGLLFLGDSRVDLSSDRTAAPPFDGRIPHPAGFAAPEPRPAPQRFEWPIARSRTEDQGRPI
jgi:hypothetical protein